MKKPKLIDKQISPKHDIKELVRRDVRSAPDASEIARKRAEKAKLVSEMTPEQLRLYQEHARQEYLRRKYRFDQGVNAEDIINGTAN